MAHKDNQNQDTVNLSIEFPKRVLDIIKSKKDLHRPRKYRLERINHEIIELITEFQIINKKPFTMRQMGYIISMFIGIKETWLKQGNNPFIKELYIKKGDLIKVIIKFNTAPRSNLTQKERIYFNKLRKFEEENGIN